MFVFCADTKKWKQIKVTLHDSLLHFSGDRPGPLGQGFPPFPGVGLPPTSMPSNINPAGSPGENGNPDDRIAKILSDATKAMKENQEAGMGLPPPPVSVAGLNLPPGFPGAALGIPGLSGDESTQEKMSKIYHEELNRIMQQQQQQQQQPQMRGNPFKGGSIGSSSHPMGDLGLFPGLLQRGAGNAATPGSPNEFARAMDIYQQELSRIQQNALVVAFRAQSKDGEGSETGDDLKRKSETPENKSSSSGIVEGGENKAPTTPSSQSSPSSSQLGKSPGPPSGLFPSTAGIPAAAAAAAAAAVSGAGTETTMSTVADLANSLSPLQRMASITNSLVSHPPMPPQGGQIQRPMRAVLPPITQQQFDKFQHLNTDETVRRVSV